MQVISLFPNGGSCSAYNSTRFFHWLSFTCACLLVALSLLLMALYPLAKLVEQLQVRTPTHRLLRFGRLS